jgi:hypothetical protein
MHYFVLPLKDSTIYQDQLIQNAGLDQIIEIQKEVETLRSASVDISGSLVSRGLIKFDITEVSEAIVRGEVTASEVYLNLFIHEATEIPVSFSLFVHPISQSWEMGSGFRGTLPITTDGCSWRRRTELLEWQSGSTTGDGGAFYTGSTGSLSLDASQSFDFSTTDARINVTDIFCAWCSGTIPNEGFVLKLSDIDEGSDTSIARLAYFSNETHTVFRPRLEVTWDDQSYNTGSLSSLVGEDLILSIKNLKEDYRQDSKTRFRVFAREKFPTKTFVTSSWLYTRSIKYLPSSSFYSVRDAYTEDEIVPFGETSKLSFDASGSFFDLILRGYEPERFYRVLFKVRKDSLETIYDNDFVFKVSR